MIEELGSDRFLYCSGAFRTVDAERGGDGAALVTARVPGGAPINVGDKVALRPAPDQVHVFSPASGLRLG